MTRPALGMQTLRRTAVLAPLRGRLAERGLRWSDARSWALREAAAGRREWKVADLPERTPNALALAAYLDHLDHLDELEGMR